MDQSLPRSFRPKILGPLRWVWFNGFPILFFEVREGTNDGLLFAILHTIVAVSCEGGAHRLPRKLRPRIKLQLLFRIYSEDAVRLARKHYQFEFLLTVFLSGRSYKELFSKEHQFKIPKNGLTWA